MVLDTWLKRVMVCDYNIMISNGHSLTIGHIVDIYTRGGGV